LSASATISEQAASSCGRESSIPKVIDTSSSALLKLTPFASLVMIEPDTMVVVQPMA